MTEPTFNDRIRNDRETKREAARSLLFPTAEAEADAEEPREDDAS